MDNLTDEEKERAIKAIRAQMVMMTAFQNLWEGWKLADVSRWLIVAQAYAEDENALTRPRHVTFSHN